MKKLLLFFILAISTNAIVAAPAPKQKKIKYSNYAYYEGMALQKSPQGRGTLYPCNRCVVTGIFNNNKIREGKIVFKEHKFTITGEFTFAVMEKEQFLIIVNNGKINRTTLPKNTPIRFNMHNYSFESHYASYPKLPKSYYELLRQFAGETTYKRVTDGRAKAIYNNGTRTRKVIARPTFLEIRFSGGTTARYDVSSKISNWTRKNGDFIEFTNNPDGSHEVSKYKITAGKCVIAKTGVTYTFENGNKYTGTIKEPSFTNSEGKTSLEKLVYFNGISWKWSEFKDRALDGVVVYPDGRSENVVDGITDSENARIKAERIAAEKEAQRKAAEAARIVAEKEAQRKAAEAARIAAEKEAQRKAAEAARIAAEKEAQRKAAEAARIAAEKEAQRKAAEEARIAAEQESQRKAAESQPAKEVEEQSAVVDSQAKREAEEARLAAEYKAKREAEEARMAAEYEARRKADMERVAAERASVAAAKEDKMKAEIERMEAERTRLIAERVAQREAEDARFAAERARVAAEKVKIRIVSAFEFMVQKKSHTGISQDNQVPRFFYHPTYNPYSPDFRAELESRLSDFCPCVGYKIVSINENHVVCLLKKETNGMISVYQLSIGHREGLLNVISFDITKANRIQ